MKGISFCDFQQWSDIKSKIQNDMMPCPYCGEWRSRLFKIPDRYLSYRGIFNDVQSDYSCEYCISKFSQSRKEREHKDDTPTCLSFHFDAANMCRDGFVYFSDCGDMRIKIGCSRTKAGIKSRLTAIKRVYGIESKQLLKAVETNCYTSLEKWFHAKFNRIDRELFLLDEYQYKYVVDLPDYIVVKRSSFYCFD